MDNQVYAVSGNMKNQPFSKWSLALLVTVLPLAGGCLQEPASASDPKGAATNNTVSALAATNEPAPPLEEENPGLDGAPAVDISEAAVKAVEQSRLTGYDFRLVWSSE